jgi:hypothetical protein
MPFKNVRVLANCDMTLIAWQTEAVIPSCRGFAIVREISGAAGDAAEGFVNTNVGSGREFNGSRKGCKLRRFRRASKSHPTCYP